MEILPINTVTALWRIAYQGDLPSLDKDDVGPLFVAARALNEPAKSIVWNNSEFKVWHTANPNTLRLSQVRKSGFSQLTPEYTVAVSNSVFDHPQAEHGLRLVSHLSRITTPWSDDGVLAGNIMERTGISNQSGRPHIVAIVAKEGDFGEGMYHGRYISIVSAGLKLGSMHGPKDVLFAVVFGSKVWKSEYASHHIAQSGFVLGHELNHFLTKLAIIGQNAVDGSHLNTSISMYQLLGRPAWEALADMLSGRVEYTWQELQWIRNGWLKMDESHSFHRQTSLLSRSLGEVSPKLNQILWSMLFRSSQGEPIEKQTYNHHREYLVATGFLNQAFGRWQIPEAELSGYLVRQIFKENGFDWKETVKKITSLSADEFNRFLAPLRYYPQVPEVADGLLEEFINSAKKWQPFGEDSLL